MTSPVAPLLAPLQFRDVILPNRIVISPMCTYSADEGIANDWHFAHLAKFALGGAGTIFVEATAIEPAGRLSQGDLGLWDDAQIAPLRRITDFMRQCGSVPAIQLGHAGRKASSQRPWIGNGALTTQDGDYGDISWPTVSAGDVPVNEAWPAPEPLAVSLMQEMIRSWQDATLRADKAGFDILEIHMAHGYLLHQFLSLVSNNRDDDYGGSLANRMRYPLEVAAAVRAAWPAGKPVFVRISAVDEGWDLEDSVALSIALSALDIDLVDCSSGGLGRSASVFRVARGYGFQVPFAEAVRRGAQIATMAVGLILDADLANTIIAEERADLVAIGRGALENPNWPLQARRTLAADRPAFERWPKQYGVWLEQRERVLQKLTTDRPSQT